ncbi:MAG: tRNA 2-selenouridine synthase [Bermanella sp.]|jgi:tRNA 2-selenouridine synthase
MNNCPKQDQSFKHLFLSNTPLMDVRAPVEFNKGAFPNSQNLPLLDDEQRTLIGTRYKQQGQDKAIELGYELATPTIKQQRLDQWEQFQKQHPDGYLYCFRGGLRSKMTQQWLSEAGINMPFIEGGYKALRTFLIEQQNHLLLSSPILLLSGRTATGKTHLLNRLPHSIDLEGLANHRGSSFGGFIEPQPSQINFENNITIDLLKRQADHASVIVMEDEGRLIGQLSLTPEMRACMGDKYPLLVLHAFIEDRIDIAMDDYIHQVFPLFIQTYGEQAQHQFSEKILYSLSRIKKRLGGELYKKIHQLFIIALSNIHDSRHYFREPIQLLLTKYYDPMYDYQLAKRQGKILFEGDASAIKEWVNEYSQKQFSE